MNPQIKEIAEYGENRFVIHYEVVSPCLCSFTRHTVIVNQKNKPTEAQALKLISKEPEPEHEPEN